MDDRNQPSGLQTRPNDGYRYDSQVPSAFAGQSAAIYLARTFPHSTETQWRQRILDGEIKVNGSGPAGLDTPLRAGDTVSWDRPPWVEPPAPQSHDVLFCDDYFLAANKPSGLPTIPGGGFLQNTLLSQVQETRPTAIPLHRLGRATSGIVLFALSAQVAGLLSPQWHAVRKIYRALASGRADNEHYEIHQKIGPVPHPRLGQIHAASATGKLAHSIAVVNERLANHTVFDVELLTGRPHQIRIHLASIGHPLVGDPVYASGGGLLPKPGLPGDSGYSLHAMDLTFTHPMTRQSIKLHCPPPAIAPSDASTKKPA